MPVTLNSPCEIGCGRKISVVDAWLPYKDGIAHHRCVLNAFEDWCAENNEPLNDESFRSWQMTVEDVEGAA